MRSGAPRDLRELVVWQKGMELAQSVYKIARLLPREETYGLSAQLRRAAVFIPSMYRRRLCAQDNARASAVRWHRPRLNRRVAEAGGACAPFGYVGDEPAGSTSNLIH